MLRRRRTPWLTLAVLAFAQFMVVLDVTIVNVALPHIQSDLHFSAEGLQWVVSAYTLVFGGFLLLGGRAADLLGRRAVFVGGLALFTAASLVAGFAWSPGSLIAARAVQGLGGALLSPAALSLLTVTFPAGRDRNVALGVWGALAGLGGTLGAVAGGVLVDALSWKWVFFVNVPIGALVALAAPALIAESRVAGTRTRRDLDVPGALLGTAGALAVVFGVVRAEPLGWGSTEVVAFLAGGLALLAAFVAVEGRAHAPLVPLRLFRSAGLRASSGALALNGAAFLGQFFLTAIYLQQVRGDSALQAGLHLFPMGIAAVVAAVVVSPLVARIGTRPIQALGAALSIVGLYLLSRAGADASYVGGLLPGLVLFGAGIVSIGIPAQIAAVVDVRHEEAGAASALIQASYQIGGALGVAIITTFANGKVTDAVAAGSTQAAALTHGFHEGLLLATAFAAINLVLAIAAPSVEPTPEQVAGAAVAA